MDDEPTDEEDRREALALLQRSIRRPVVRDDDGILRDSEGRMLPQPVARPGEF